MLGVVAGEHAREAGQRGHERLQVAHGVAAPRRLVVGAARERRVAALAVDVAEDAQRVGDVAGAQALVDHARGVEVGDRLLQVAEAQPRLAAVGQRQRAEGGEATEVGEADGEVELPDGGLVAALLQVARAAVDADADDLQDVAGALGVVECAQVVSVVAGAVALERREHGQHGVSRRQRAVLAAGHGDLVSARGERPARLGVAAQPVGAGMPGVQQRGVARRRAVVTATPVGLQRLVEVPAQVVDEADAPRQSGVDRARGARGPAQARERLVRVAAQLVGLAQQPLERGVAVRGGHRVAGLDDGLDRSLAQQRRALLGEQAHGGGVVADRPPRAQRQPRLARFPRPGHLTSFPRLIPSEHSSGQTRRHRRSPARGPVVGFGGA